jgi:hypothetical protein
MWPSGYWRGFWEQEFWGRRWMDPLLLRFSNGGVDGEGQDCIGRFTFAGSYAEDGSVRLVKQYIGRHSVLYQGSVDGEGAIVGRWSIASRFTGPFALMPILDDTTQLAITAIGTSQPRQQSNALDYCRVNVAIAARRDSVSKSLRDGLDRSDDKCPFRSGQIQTFSHTGGITSDRIRVSVDSSRCSGRSR